MSNIPSKYATCSISYGAKKKHLFCPDNESLEFHATEAEARKEIEGLLATGDKMAAMFKIVGLFKADITLVEIS